MTVWFHSYIGYKTETHGIRQQYDDYQREEGESGVKGKGGQIYGDGRPFDFGGKHSAIYRSCVTQMYS